MARIGKHKNCGGEFGASGIYNDVIEEITCKKCMKTYDVRIVPLKKKKLIREFERQLGSSILGDRR